MNKTEKKTNAITIVIALLFYTVFQFIPAPEGLSRLSMEILGIFIGTVILWLSVSIDWPSLLCIAAIGITGLLDFNSILSSFLGNSTISFLIFSYMMAYALGESGLLKRFALWFISRPFARKKPWLLLLMLLLAAMIVGLVIIPSTMILIFMPIMIAMFRQCGLKEGDSLAEIVVLMVAFTGSIAQGMTPIGHAHPVIAMSVLTELTGYEISYSDFMLFAVPVGLICIASMTVFFRFVIKPEMKPFSEVDVNILNEEYKPMNIREKLVMVIFLAVVFCWLAPALLIPISRPAADWFKQLGNVYPPLIGVVLMCMIKIDGKPLCEFKKAVSVGVPWGIVFLVGATVVLSGALTNAATGISAWLSGVISNATNGLSPFCFSLVIISAAVILTNFSSNAVTASLLTSITIPVALLMPEKLNPYAMAAVIGASVNYAFATPLATAVVAIAAGSGWVKTKKMALYGTVIGVISILVFAFVGYPLANAILPYSN